jgi:AcrR family transcriptional regulator
MREQARETIVAAALRVFGEKGFDGATTAEVAKSAGVSKGLVFNYFPTKLALLQALIEQTLGDALDCWEQVGWEGDPADQLARIVDAGVGEVLRRPEFHRLYFSLVVQPGGSAAVEAATAKLMPRLGAYYGRTAGLMAALGSDDPESDSRLFQFALNGLAQTIVVSPGMTSDKAKPVIEKLKARLLARFVPDKAPAPKRRRGARR